MSNDLWDWPGAFERAGKADGGRVVETLKPEDFARALRSMWAEHGMLERSDPRVQLYCRVGVLEWWDGKGRCVMLIREGSGVGRVVGGANPQDRFGAPDYMPIPAGTPEAQRAQEAQFEHATPAPLVVGPPLGPPGVDLGPPKVELRETIKAKGKKK